uniref:7TM_GPCR_Srx domain-containing protein n=1 Tax=Rhabditophanes sp. KR3021 TaxID=114890 RepID=A0AC35U2B6_9BILA
MGLLLALLERILATRFRRNYSKQPKVWIILMFGCLQYGYGGLIKYINSVAIDFWNAHFFEVCMLLDLISSVISVFLYFQNKHIRMKASNKVLSLEEKFQLVENIKIIKMIMPMIILFYITNFVTNVTVTYLKFLNVDVQSLCVLDYGIMHYTYLYFAYKVFRYNKYTESYKNFKKYVLLSLFCKPQFRANTAGRKITAEIGVKFTTASGVVTSLKLFDSTGKNMTTKADGNDYFRQIEKSWK